MSAPGAHCAARLRAYALLLSLAGPSILYAAPATPQTPADPIAAEHAGNREALAPADRDIAAAHRPERTAKHSVPAATGNAERVRALLGAQARDRRIRPVTGRGEAAGAAGRAPAAESHGANHTPLESASAAPSAPAAAPPMARAMAQSRAITPVRTTARAPAPAGRIGGIAPSRGAPGATIDGGAVHRRF